MREEKISYFSGASADSGAGGGRSLSILGSAQFSLGVFSI